MSLLKTIFVIFFMKRKSEQSISDKHFVDYWLALIHYQLTSIVIDGKYIKRAHPTWRFSGIFRVNFVAVEQGCTGCWKKLVRFLVVCLHIWGRQTEVWFTPKPIGFPIMLVNHGEEEFFFIIYF